MSEHEAEQVGAPPKRGCCGCGGGGKTSASTSTLATDPVCGMKVDPATPKHRFDHGGTTYDFCCGGCRAKFAADPAKYL
jgi:Cu+-exporting ATPase